ncbi:MYB DNA-binding domain protein [Trichophyton verrucosum HKI 0517]|uniref:MYB DNA-binding domain protein n=1 Tax=Trichophyton verrucosum (strain HKI 0517) TaxID=663202 RepID=D4CZK9_TRIVH|nr:MYB DNA-binding domain protein [Trichophyton verrucosum HKI 0517]EFE45000.1 MYB DNA-binding domain protein [Trichophyton verrucosum HKI 0517]
MAQTRSAVTPTTQSQPPKSRSVSAKRAQGTSSRVTRSRSRELGESPAPASFKVPSLPPKRDEVGGQKPVPKTPRASDASTGRNNLSPITEDCADGPRIGIEFSPNHQSYISQTYVAESHTDHGNISGTTMLQTDESGYETDEPDLHLLLDTLPDLLNASTKALDLLAPPGISYANISKYFQTPKFSARLNRTKVTFETQKKCITKANFIPVDRSVKALSSIKKLDWQSRGVYQKANLAQLALDLINPRLTTLTATVDDSFPLAFMDSRSLGDSRNSADDGLRKETFQIGLELRTQRFISSLLSGSPGQYSELEELLADVFYNPSLGEVNTELKGWEMDSLMDEDDQLPEEFHGAVQERIDLIRKLVVQEGGLEARFPWSEFIVSIANWIRRRVNAIDQQLRSQIPVAEAMKILQSELDKRSSFGSGNPMEPISDPTIEEVEPPVERNTTPDRTMEIRREDREEPPAAISPTTMPRRRFRGRGALQQVLAAGPARDAPSIPKQANTAELVEPLQAPENPITPPRRRFRGKGALQKVLATEPVQDAPSMSEQTTSTEITDAPQAPASPALHPPRRFQRKAAIRYLLGIGATDESSSGIPADGTNIAPSVPQIKEGPETQLIPVQDSLFDDEVLGDGLQSPPLQNTSPRPTPGVRTQESPRKNGPSNSRSEELPPLSAADIWRLSEEGNIARKSKQVAKKLGAFIDRQANAHRVSPISFSPSPRASAAPVSSPQKRGAEALDYGSDESESDDDEFESDNRPVKKRRVISAAAPPRPTPGSIYRGDRTNNSRAATRTRSPSTTAPPPQRFESVNAEVQRAGNWAPRRAWSLEEETCLRELIEVCGGPSWAEIKRRDSMAGNILSKRTQVQIKDKGAQMHYDDLMTGRPLTEGMANVPIKAKMRDRLIKEGKIEASSGTL